MEQKIENAIDYALDRVSVQLHMFSIGLGVVLVILGIILFLKKTGSKGMNNVGLICIVIGIFACVSGFLQL